MKAQGEKVSRQYKLMQFDHPHDGTALQYRHGFLILLLFCFYLLMFLHYRPYDVDNPWFLSFSYNACVEHISTDQFLLVQFPSGMDGTQYFGRIAAFLQCAILNRTGWQQWPAAIFTAFLVVSALWLWAVQLRKLGFNRTFINVFLLTAGLSEPFLSAANRFRYESVSFFLLSLGLVLIAYNSLFWGMFVGTLAIEVQPIGVAGVIPLILLACITKKLTSNQWARLAAGAVSGAAVYVSLHLNLFTDHMPPLSHATDGQFSGFIASYFLERIRHLPELGIFVTMAFIYWRRRRTIQSHYAALSALLIMLLAFAMSHGNPAYMIFLYPFLIVASLSAIQIERNWRFVVAAVLFYFLTPYAVLAYLNRGKGYSTTDIHQVSDTIQQIARDRGVEAAKLRVYGDYSLWFAHPGNYRAASFSTADKIQDADLYLCFDRSFDIAALQPLNMFYCQDILARVLVHPIRAMEVHGNKLYFYVR